MRFLKIHQVFSLAIGISFASMITRRALLSNSLKIAAFSPLLAACSSHRALNNWQYQINPWSGDTFEPMHKVRDGWKPNIPPPSKHFEIVIVGSGIAGLTAAFKLRDRNILILERESETGGNAKSGEYRGIRYSKGAAYLVDTEGEYGELYSDLNLELKPLGDNTDLIWNDSRFSGFEKSKIAHDFEKLRGFFEKFIESDDFPAIPISDSSAESLKLDKISFYDFLKNDYSQEFLRLVDTYSFSALGASAKETSAYAGLNFYSEIAAPIYAFPGGNGFIAKRLTERIEGAGSGRIERGCSVVAVEQHGKKVWISYIQTANAAVGEPEVTTISADHAILSLPYLFVPRIFKDAKDLKGLRYGSYLVANLCFDKVVLRDGYDHWVPGSETITDFIDADYVNSPSTKVGDSAPFVFSVYAPFRNTIAGRVELFLGNQAPLAQRVIGAVQEYTNFDPSSLKEISLSRYGHQVMQCPPGQISRLRLQRKRFGRIILAHSDGQGLPAIESAISEGLRAAKEIL